MAAQNFKLFLGCLGNGVTVCNSAVMEDGDPVSESTKELIRNQIF